MSARQAAHSYQTELSFGKQSLPVSVRAVLATTDIHIIICLEKSVNILYNTIYKLCRQVRR